MMEIGNVLLRKGTTKLFALDVLYTLLETTMLNEINQRKYNGSTLNVIYACSQGSVSLR